MTNSAPNPTPQPAKPTSPATTDVPPTPLRCFTGSLFAGALALLLYRLNGSIIQALGSKPLPTGNATAVNIAVAVRTLVIGLSTMATTIFAIAALGLAALGMQLLVQKFLKPSQPND